MRTLSHTTSGQFKPSAQKVPMVVSEAATDGAVISTAISARV